jgi:hypothetical protein
VRRARPQHRGGRERADNAPALGFCAGLSTVTADNPSQKATGHFDGSGVDVNAAASAASLMGRPSP